MLASPLRDLALVKLPQLVHLRRITRDDTLDHFDSLADGIGSVQSIRRRLSLDLDHPDTWIIFASVVFPVTEIP